MPNKVARALKTQARGFLACFAKPPVLQMKNIVSQEFKGTERLDLAMMKPEDSPSHTVPIRALNSWPTSSVAHMPCSIPRAVESLKKETEFRVNLDHHSLDTVYECNMTYCDSESCCSSHYDAMWTILKTTTMIGSTTIILSMMTTVWNIHMEYKREKGEIVDFRDEFLLDLHNLKPFLIATTHEVL